MLWKMACAFTQFMIKQIVKRVRKMLNEITLELFSYEKSNVVENFEKMPKRKRKFLIYFGFEKLNVMENTMSVYTIYIKNILHKII